MTEQSIQPYFHPTTIVMVDDNQRFLDNFSLQLDESLAFRTFASPRECLAILNGHAQRTPLDRRCMSYYQQPSQQTSGRVVRLDLTLIEQEISNPDRFSDVSIVIVDYDMPEMTGLEFCKSLRNKRIKKVLLTGVADEKVAVSAFNDGIIDRFLMKSDPNITEKLNHTIRDLQRRYFDQVSTLLQDALALEQPEYLEDTHFSSFFFSLMERKHIAEYYYVEDPDGFLLVSDTGRLYRLIIQDEACAQRNLFLLKKYKAPASIRNKVASGTAVAWLWSTPDEYDESEDFLWSEHIHPAKKVQGKKEWLCALVENPPADIEYDSATSSYLAYLESLDKQ